MTPNKNQNRRSMFKIQMEKIAYLLKQRTIQRLGLGQKDLPLY